MIKLAYSFNIENTFIFVLAQHVQHGDALLRINVLFTQMMAFIYLYSELIMSKGILCVLPKYYSLFFFASHATFAYFPIEMNIQLFSYYSCSMVCFGIYLLKCVCISICERVITKKCRYYVRILKFA